MFNSPLRNTNNPIMQERLDSGGKLQLDPDNECFECYRSNRMSGWCVIVDSIDADGDPKLEAYKRNCLRKHDDALERGERVQATLKLVSSPIPGEAKQRANEYKQIAQFNKERHHRY